MHLTQIAKDIQEELRDGIAWFYIYKTGRTWHCTLLWGAEYNEDDGSFIFSDSENKSVFKQLQQEHRDGITINGYYNAFSEQCTIQEIMRKIRYFYENKRERIKKEARPKENQKKAYLGDYVRTRRNNYYGRVYQKDMLYNNKGIVDDWFRLQENVSESDLARPWYHILVDTGGSIYVPEHDIIVINECTIINPWLPFYFGKN